MVLSSNSFANNSNPNAGNVLSERSSTRRIAGPGGNSTIVLGGDDVAAEQKGTTTSNSFASGANPNSGNVLTERPSTRVHAAPGGESSLGSILGGDHGANVQSGTTSNNFASGANPNSGNVLTERPTTRVHAAPGGESSLGSILGGDYSANVQSGTTSNSFASGANPNSGNVLTERSSTRVHAAPGGESSLGGILGGCSSADEGKRTATSNSFASGANPNSGNVLTERSSTRVHAAPGGESSLGSILGGSAPTDVDLGKNNTTSNSFASGANPNSGNVLTDRRSTQVLAAPGGESSLGSILGGDHGATEQVGTTTSNSFASGANPNSGNVLTERPSTRVHAAPGGESSLGGILGGPSSADGGKRTTTSNSFASSANPNSGNVLTERSSTRVHAAPGGESSLGSILGGSSPTDVDLGKNKTTSNSFASGANPNSGNVLTDRRSTQVLAAPGGESSLGSILGGDHGATVHLAATTSNSFASGANPNSGNVLTERPSTRVHAAPGGESSLGGILGGNSPIDVDCSESKNTSNRFASGANPNSGNVLTERSSTRIRCAPGGASSVTLGGDGYDAPGSTPKGTKKLANDENSNTTSYSRVDAPKDKHVRVARRPFGTSSNIMLG